MTRRGRLAWVVLSVMIAAGAGWGASGATANDRRVITYHAVPLPNATIYRVGTSTLICADGRPAVLDVRQGSRRAPMRYCNDGHSAASRAADAERVMRQYQSFVAVTRDSHR